MKKLILLLVVFALPQFSWAQVLVFQANLTGSQEVPANASPATGFASATLDTTTNLFVFNQTWSGLLANTSGAHIHGGAPGVNGPIVIPFTVNTTVNSGAVSFSGVLTAAQVTNLISGLWYTNVHSTQFQGGEIRGQLLQPGTVPEPGTYALAGAALLSVLFARRALTKRIDAAC